MWPNSLPSSVLNLFIVPSVTSVSTYAPCLNPLLCMFFLVLPLDKSWLFPLLFMSHGFLSTEAVFFFFFILKSQVTRGHKLSRYFPCSALLLSHPLWHHFFQSFWKQKLDRNIIIEVNSKLDAEVFRPQRIGILVNYSNEKNSKWYSIMHFSFPLHVIASVNHFPFTETFSFFGFLVVILLLEKLILFHIWKYHRTISWINSLALSTDTKPSLSLNRTITTACFTSYTSTTNFSFKAIS